MKILLSFLLLSYAFFPAHAQNTYDSMVVGKQILEQKTKIELIEPMLTENDLNEDRILELRQTLRSVRTELQSIVDVIEPANDDVKANIADLGPLPIAVVEGEVPAVEPENIQRQRALLNEKSFISEGLLKEAEALKAKSSRLLEKITSLQRSRFLNQLFETQTSPFNAKLWPSAIEAYVVQLSNYKLPFQEKDTGQLVGITLSSLLFLLLFFVGSALSKKSLLAKLQNLEKNSLFSLVSSSLALPLLGVVVGLFFIYQTLNAQEVITDSNTLLTHKAFGLTAFLIFVHLVTKRLAKVGIIRTGMRWLALLTALLFTTDVLFLESSKIVGMPLELSIAQSYIVTGIFALLLGVCSYITVKTSSSEVRYFFPRQIFVILLGVSVFIIAANTFGYAALSRYLFELFVLLFSLFTLVITIRSAVRPHLCSVDMLLSQSGKAGSDQAQERLIFFWLSLALDLILLFICLPIIAGIVGAEWQDIQEWITQAFFGFKIGTMTLSIANIGIAVVVFFLLLFATRIIQRVLRQKILPKTKMDEAVRQSITQILGYIGLIIALMAGISAVGFDLSNLALIAGALSVGIGFGLQSIVSNFVSGLILLFERPIKVGDWIITSSGEGIVKRINVRATEIETFDRTSIIVPNSELISSSVKNWTHKDKIGRVIITVGVSYSSNPQEVRDLLLQCVSDSKNVLNTPEPTVHFMDFADSALIFDIKFFIRNIKDIYTIGTQIRFDIWDALKAADVEISFPQRDLHIRSAEGLKDLKGLTDGK